MYDECMRPDSQIPNGPGFPPTAEGYPGSKWEYEIIDTRDYAKDKSEDFDPLRFGARVKEIINEMGLDGWELTGVSPSATENHDVLYFKRRIY